MVIYPLLDDGVVKGDGDVLLAKTCFMCLCASSAFTRNFGGLKFLFAVLFGKIGFRGSY